MSEVSNAFSAKRIIRPVLVGTLIGGAVCIALLALAAVVMTGVDIPKPVIIPLSLAIACVSAFIGGFSAAVIAGKTGWLVGILSGLLLFLLILVGGFVLLGEVRGSLVWIKLALLLAGGMIGGMIGVNLRKRR